MVRLLGLLWILLNLCPSCWAQNQAGFENDYVSLEIFFDGDQIEKISPLDYRGLWSTHQLRLYGKGRIKMDAQGSNCSIGATMEGLGIPNKSFSWASNQSPATEKSFDLTLNIPTDYKGPILLTANTAITGGTTVGGQIRVDLQPAPSILTATDTATPLPRKETPKPGTPRAWVVGGLLALLISVAVMAVKLRSSGQPRGYLLQVDRQHVVLAESEPGWLEISTYEVLPTGAFHLSPLPWTTRCPSKLRVQPQRGQGKARLKLSGSRGRHLLKLSSPGAPSLSVWIEIRPEEWEWVIYPYDGDIFTSSGHHYQGHALEPGEFAADGRDVVKLAAFLSPKAPSQRRTLALPHPPQATLVGPDAVKFFLDPLTQEAQPGIYTYRVRSRHPLLLQGDRPLQLKLEAHLPAPLSQKVSGSLALGAQYLFLKLWVLPSLKPGHSEASAFVRLPRHAEGFLEGVPLELGVECAGTGLLKPTNASPCRQKTNPKGFCWWLLEYAQLSWEKLDSACFRVKVGFPEEQGVREATEFVISLKDNLHKLLGALVDQRHDAGLELDNPYLRSQAVSQGDLSMALQELALLQFPEYLLGPAWNCLNFSAIVLKEALPLATEGAQSLQSRPVPEAVRELFPFPQSAQAIWEAGLQATRSVAPGSGMAAELFSEGARLAQRWDEQVKPWVCGGLSRRVHDWLAQRRFRGPSFQSRCLMNGIEIHQWKLGIPPFSHHWAGLFLSGNRPLSEETQTRPLFIDPWWRQAWESDAYRQPEGLLDHTQERLHAQAMLVSLTLVLVLTTRLPTLYTIVLAILAQQRPCTEISSDDDQSNLDPEGFYAMALGKGQKKTFKGYQYDWESEALAWLSREYPSAPPVKPVRPW